MMSDDRKYSGWAPKPQIEALGEQEKATEDKPKRGRPRKEKDVSDGDVQ